MEKIIGVYKITNIITGDFYIGSSNDVKGRWVSHKCQSTWKRFSNNQLYQDMKKYGVDKFEFQVLANVEPEQLIEKEQEFIEILKPTYNNRNAKGRDTERYKEYQKEHYKEHYKAHKDELKTYQKDYDSQLCYYNGETITLGALRHRFAYYGISNPVKEAKKYIELKK